MSNAHAQNDELAFDQHDQLYGEERDLAELTLGELLIEKVRMQSQCFHFISFVKSKDGQ